MIRKLKLFVLKLRLRGIFNQAEALVNQGVETGDVRFIDLYNRAYRMSWVDGVHYNPPALEELRKLMLPPEPVNYDHIAGYTLLALLGTGAAIGIYGAYIHMVYHLTLRLFGG